MATIGRPRDSCVWNFFKYLKENKSVVCLVTWSVGEPGKLGHSIQGKFRTNLNCHLKTKHYEQFKELQKKESNIKEK